MANKKNSKEEPVVASVPLSPATARPLPQVKLSDEQKKLKTDFSVPEYDEKSGPKDAWWAGTFKTLPRGNIVIGGVQFVDYINPPVAGSDLGDGQQRSYSLGSIVNLNPKQVKRVLYNISRKVVELHLVREHNLDHGPEKKARNKKRAGVRPGGSIRFLDHTYYSPSERHIPLAKFVYFVPMSSLPSGYSRMDPDALPASVYDMWGGGAKAVNPEPARSTVGSGAKG